jgi:GAF domain-containing protein/HAMP domain-containing protein
MVFFKFFRNLNLGVKLNVVVVLTLATLLATFVIVVDRNVRTLTVRMGQQRVEQEIEVIQGRFAETEAETLAVAKILASRPSLIEAAENEMESRVRTAMAVGAAPFSLDSIIVIRSDRSPIAVLPDEGAIADFKQVHALSSLALLGVETTELSIDEEKQELWLSAAAPLRHGSGAIFGAVLTSRRMDDEFLADINFYRNDVHVALITEERILAQDLPTPERSEEFNPVSLEKILAEQVLSGQTLVTGDLLHSTDGVPYALAYTPLTVLRVDTSVAFSIMVDLGELSAFQHQLTNNTTTIVLFLALVAAIAIAVFVWRSVAAPLGRLRSVAEGITSGDYEQRAEVKSADEVGQLAKAFNIMTVQLQQTLEGLEQRTFDLQRHSAQLQTSAEVAHAASSILNVDQLTQQVVELIHEQFSLYYVGLFLVDEPGEWAVLRTGTGKAGRAMLARGHRIKVGEGMIGWSIANAQPRIALDVGEDVVRLVIAELPHTRSEAALPLRSRGRVLGALSVQSDQPAAFDQDTIVAWQTMADQLALALDNAHLFTETQQALQAARRAYAERSRDAWTELLRTRPEWGYSYERKSIAPAEGAWRPEMLQAAQTGQSVQGDGAGGATLTIPLKVREQVVGVLDFHRGDTGETWTADEVALLETLAEQLSAALESAQLYQHTQRRVARERLTSEVTARMRETLDMDTVLQTAIREFGKILDIAEVEVRMSGGVKTES